MFLYDKNQVQGLKGDDNLVQNARIGNVGDLELSRQTSGIFWIH